MAEWKDMQSSSPVRTLKLQLTIEQPSTGQCWIPPKKILCVQVQRRSPNKMVGGAKSCLESNTIPTRDAQRAHTKPCVHQDPETPQRLSQNCLECLSVSFRGTGQQWPDVGTGTLVAADLGDMMCEPHHRGTKQTMQKLENNYTKELLTLLQKF